MPVCEHGFSEEAECEECIWARTMADDQADDEDWFE
jgi:hypothetical protein